MPKRRVQALATSRRTPAAERRIVEDASDPWIAVAKIHVVADGRAFAGESGGFRACAWDAAGTSAWRRTLCEHGTDSRYYEELGIQLVGDVLLAHGKYKTTIWMLDAATGTTRGELAIPKASAFTVSPDGTRLVLRTGTETTVLAFPTLDPVAVFPEYCNHATIAISRNGKWLAVNGGEVHVYDLAAAHHVRTFEPPETPWAMCFTPSHRLVTGDNAACLRLYDPATGKQVAEADAAAERSRKPTITAIAASAEHVAAGREDGTVALFDAKLKLVRLFKKHDTTQPGTAARSLGDVAFSADGTRLWVSAGAKQQPIGLTVYPL